MAPVNRNPCAPPTVALMFHAVGDGDLEGQPARYTLSKQQFADILTGISERDKSGVSAVLWRAGHPGVILTFDDGHRSNYTCAFPLLLEHKMCADFFVNPATVGTPGFVSWPELCEMHRQGMSIQSHGYDHRYLTDYTPQALRDSLSMSRLEIEDKVGAPVALLAPPGGRIPLGLGATAVASGFSAVFTSRPGFVRDTIRMRFQPRLAVTSNTSLTSAMRWVEGSLLPIGALAVRYTALAAAKRMLGNAIYERARMRLIRHDEMGT